MILPVIYSKKAIKDLLEIYDYISFYLINPPAAKRITEKIKEKIISLSYFPKQYPISKINHFNKLNLRSFSVNNFTVFYTLDYEINTVVIMRIIYNKVNIEELEFE